MDALRGRSGEILGVGLRRVRECEKEGGVSMRKQGVRRMDGWIACGEGVVDGN